MANKGLIILGLAMAIYGNGGCDRPKDKPGDPDYSGVGGDFYTYVTQTQDLHSRNLRIAWWNGHSFIDVAEKVDKAERILVNDDVVVYVARDAPTNKAGAYAYRKGKGSLRIGAITSAAPDIKGDADGISYYIENGEGKRSRIAWSDIRKLLN